MKSETRKMRSQMMKRKKMMMVEVPPDYPTRYKHKQNLKKFRKITESKLNLEHLK